MSGRFAGANLLNELNTLTHVGVVGHLSDAELIDRFRARGGEAAEAAFQALVTRHGPMVLDVCGSVLRNTHDAEDAFQATFLVLASRAGSIKRRNALASWLLGVARRVALRSRADVARRRLYEMRAAKTEADRTEAPPESWPELHEEIGRLPARYREPVVLCYLEGLSTEAAALRLGCPHGTVLSRLSRARERLRGGLTRRGLALPAGLLAAVLVPEAARAAVPASLISATVRASLEFTKQPATTQVLSSTTAVTLATGELCTMMVTKMKIIGATVLACGLAVGGLHAVATGGSGFLAQGQDPNVPKGPPTNKAAVQRDRVERPTTKLTHRVDKVERRKFTNEAGWMWFSTPQELRIGHRWGQTRGDDGMMVMGYAIVNADGRALQIVFSQAGRRVAGHPACRLVVFDKVGARHLPKWVDEGGIGADGMKLTTAIYTLDPKELAPGEAAYIGVEQRAPKGP